MPSQFEVHRAKDCAIFKFPLGISAEADEIIKVAAIEANTIYFIVSLQLFRLHNTSNQWIVAEFRAAGGSSFLPSWHQWHLAEDVRLRRLSEDAPTWFGSTIDAGRPLQEVSHEQPLRSCVGWVLRSFGSPHHVGIGSSKRGNPEDRTRVHSQGEDRRPGVGREQRDDHHAAAGWFF